MHFLLSDCWIQMLWSTNVFVARTNKKRKCNMKTWHKFMQSFFNKPNEILYFANLSIHWCGNYWNFYEKPIPNNLSHFKRSAFLSSIEYTRFFFAKCHFLKTLWFHIWIMTDECALLQSETKSISYLNNTVWNRFTE